MTLVGSLLFMLMVVTFIHTLHIVVSALRPLTSNESGLDSRIAYILYTKLWRNQDTWEEITKKVEERVPSQDVFPLEAPVPARKQLDAEFSEQETTIGTHIDIRKLVNWNDDWAVEVFRPRFLVRDEYIELDKHIDDPSNRRDILLTGQPGIG